MKTKFVGSFSLSQLKSIFLSIVQYLFVLIVNIVLISCQPRLLPENIQATDSAMPDQAESIQNEDLMPPDTTSKEFSDKNRNISFNFPSNWDLYVNQSEDSQLFVSIFDQIAQEEFNDGNLDIHRGALIQFQLNTLKGNVPDIEGVLLNQIKAIDPQEPGLFFDPEGTFTHQRYRTSNDLEGLLGSAKSSIVLHEIFVFLKDEKTLGKVDLIAYRPIPTETAEYYKSSFFAVVDTIQVDDVQ